MPSSDISKADLIGVVAAVGLHPAAASFVAKARCTHAHAPQFTVETV